MFDRQKKGDRAVLVLPHSRGEGDTARRAAEFAELVKSAGADVVARIRVFDAGSYGAQHFGAGGLHQLDEFFGTSRRIALAA